VSLKLPRTGHKNICQHPSSTSFDDSTEISKWDYNTHAVTHFVAKKNGTILSANFLFSFMGIMLNILSCVLYVIYVGSGINKYL
jgi:hypothetical protein